MFLSCFVGGKTLLPCTEEGTMVVKFMYEGAIWIIVGWLLMTPLFADADHLPQN